MISPTKIKRDDEDCGGGDGQHDCDKEEGNPAGHSPLSPTVGSHDAVRYSYNGSDYGNDYHYRDIQLKICAKTGNNGFIQIFQRAPNRPPPHFLVTNAFKAGSQRSHPALNW